MKAIEISKAVGIKMGWDATYGDDYEMFYNSWIISIGAGCEAVIKFTNEFIKNGFIA